MANTELNKFSSFLSENGVIYGPEPVIYEPIAGHYTYGPLGKGIKNEVEKYIRYIFNLNEYVEIECPLIYPRIVWKNSGHWDKFQDPIIYTKAGKCYRLDKEIEKQFDVIYGNLTKEQIFDYMKKLKPINDDSYIIKEEIEYKNLMMTTQSGSTVCALRPETATTTYTTFRDVYNYYGKLPIKLYQIGKAFRNEISPHSNIIRCREFTQAEAHVFLTEEMKNTNIEHYEEYKNEKLPILFENTIIELSLEECINRKLFQTKYYASVVYIAYDLFKNIIPKDKIRLRQHAPDERAFYALDAWDIEININNMGFVEVCGIHDRGNYDLTQHKYEINPMPHILELAIGVDRLIYSLLDIYYDKKQIDDGKSILKIPYFLAPIKIAVMPLLSNKPELVNKAEQVYKLMKKHYITTYSEKQSIGKRYLKNAIKGIPYSITIDFDTLKDNTVTVRDRDTEKQTRVDIIELIKWFRNVF